MAFDENYVEVPERIVEFRAKHPDGTLQCSVIRWPEEGFPFIAVEARAYRTPDDERPGVGLAYEPFPGKTPFTRDSELQNAETSAWGRAIVAVGAADTKRGIASAQEVRNRASGAGSSPGGEAPSGPARLGPDEEPVSDTIPPAASPEASSVAAAGGEAAGKPSDPPAAPGDYEGPATEEQWNIARQHIGSVPTILGKYQLKFGSRKKKPEVTQLELAELIEEALTKAPA